MENKPTKRCEGGCEVCDPYSYKVEVDLFFLNQVKSAYQHLKENSPEHFAEGWMTILDNYIKNVTRKQDE